MTRHQHYVSRSYQRGFADGKRIILVDKHNRTRREVGIGDAFVARSHSSFTDMNGRIRNELEEKWGKIENLSSKQIRRVMQDNMELDVDVTNAIKASAALHFARSQSIREVTPRLEHDFYLEYAKEAELNVSYRQQFFMENGREPLEGELADLVLSRAKYMIGSNFDQVNRMEHIYNQLLEIFDPYYVQLIRPMRGQAGFSFSDSPLVNHCRRTDRIGPSEGLAIGDSDLLLIPLARYLCVAFTATQEPHVIVKPSQVESINHLTWRSAARFVGHHPKEHPGGVIPNFAEWLAEANSEK